MQFRLLAIALGGIGFASAQNVTIPTCAQNCLTNSTSAQGSCTALDCKCLCSNANWINVLSCCLSTTCTGTDQQKAILYNVEECANVNATFPDFVGCSPLGIGSAAVSFNTATLTSTPTAMSTPKPTVSTIQSVESAFTSFLGAKSEVATFTGGMLLMSTCTNPVFETVTDSQAMETEYPWIGCTHDQEGCCPFDSHENAVLTVCPMDYFTTASACCPLGWSIYSTNLGGQTPCVTSPPTPLIPAATPTGSGTVVINNLLFSRKYELGPKKTGLSGGAKAGIAVGGVFAVLAVAAALGAFIIQRRKVRKAAAAEAAGTATSEKGLGSPGPAPVELPSPHSRPQSPGSTLNSWVSPSSIPPHLARARSPLPPQELPGSTHIYEHHPAFSSEDLIASAAVETPPKTRPVPARSPSSGVIFPLESPKNTST